MDDNKKDNDMTTDSTKDSGEILSNPDNIFDNSERVSSDHSRTLELRTVEDVMEDSYLRYSMSVIVARALPDVRDGMKPVT